MRAFQLEAEKMVTFDVYQLMATAETLEGLLTYRYDAVGFIFGDSFFIFPHSSTFGEDKNGPDLSPRKISFLHKRLAR